jgi:hypothetical protein
MNIKQMALVKVLTLMGSAAFMGVVVTLSIDYWGMARVGTVLAICVFAYLCKLVYDIELSKLEHTNALTKLKDIK